jgi:UDP-glucose 6-dehydrogenase
MSRDWLRRLSNIWEKLPADDVETAIRESTTLFVCVSTPQRGNGEADLLQPRKSRSQS